MTTNLQHGTSDGANASDEEQIPFSQLTEEIPYLNAVPQDDILINQKACIDPIIREVVFGSTIISVSDRSHVICFFKNSIRFCLLLIILLCLLYPLVHLTNELIGDKLSEPLKGSYIIFERHYGVISNESFAYCIPHDNFRFMKGKNDRTFVNDKVLNIFNTLHDEQVIKNPTRSNNEGHSSSCIYNVLHWFEESIGVKTSFDTINYSHSNIYPDEDPHLMGNE